MQEIMRKTSGANKQPIPLFFIITRGLAPCSLPGAAHVSCHEIFTNPATKKQVSRATITKTETASITSIRMPRFSVRGEKLPYYPTMVGCDMIWRSA